jgi:drug/metabolite transporter (DMT)-like permease
MHLSVLLWGLTGVLGRGINLSEGYLVWYRIMIASVTLGIYAVLTKRFVLPSKRDGLKMTGIGVLLTVHWLFFYGAIKYSNISITLSMLASQALVYCFLRIPHPPKTHRQIRNCIQPYGHGRHLDHLL